MPFSMRGAPILGEETTSPNVSATTEPEITKETGLGQTAVEEAMRVIQKHIDKEARNRWVEHLDVRDLCPRQKADLVADLAKMF